MTAIQSEYSLWTRDPEPEILPLCEALGIGFLAGKIDAKTRFEQGDIRAASPRFTQEARAANQAVVNLPKRIAARKKAAPA